MHARKFISLPPMRSMIPKNRSNLVLNASRRITSSNKFTVLSYNMLSPYYMWPQVYHYVPDKFKNWTYRHQLLEDELLRVYKADIMCLQEMTNEDYLHYWKSAFDSKLNYGSNFVAKTPPEYWTQTKQQMDGEGIFYNRDKFDYISSTNLYLNDVAGTFDEHELQYMKTKIVNLTDGSGNPVGQNNLHDILSKRNQVCLFVCLKHKETNNVFVVINTHLYWKYDEVKLTQCMIIMRKLSNIIDKLLLNSESPAQSKNVKIIFTGDLNSTRDSLVIKFLKGDNIKHGELNMINPMKPYLNYCCYDGVPTTAFDHTCYSGKLKGVFDYLWYHDTDIQLTKILSGAEVSKELEATKEFGLPNQHHPSDHIPLLAEFELL